MVKVVKYTYSFAKQWDDLVTSARNATLLHLRNYMDYHSDRFKDVSLMFFNQKGNIIAAFPACFCNNDNKTIISHQGLTYGGLIASATLHSQDVEEIFNSAIDYYKNEIGANKLIIKPIPYIYNSAPSEEELFFIHKNGGKLVERNLSQALLLNSHPAISQLRRRCINKAQKAGLTFKEENLENGWKSFHEILSDVLKDRHSTLPVHTEEELWLLHTRFPQNIKLFTAYRNDTMQAGTIVYISKNVVHTQYLASSEEGFQCGALDFVISNVMANESMKKHMYLDFGISTERDGSLNKGLALQKEGFGARGVCYDTYLITL